MISPDPVAAPSAYQAMLLALLGSDDPLLAQAATLPSLRAVLTEVPGVIRQRPEPAEWSVLEVAGHILDAEIVYSGRYRFTLAHDAPRLPGYDQDLWVDRLRHNEDDPEDLLAQFTALRAANLALLAAARRTPSGSGWGCTTSAAPRATTCRSASSPATTGSTWRRRGGPSPRCGRRPVEDQAGRSSRATMTHDGPPDDRAHDGADQVDPQRAHVAAKQGRPDRPGRVDRRAAEGHRGEVDGHQRERDDEAGHGRRLLARGQDDQDEDGREHRLQDQGLDVGEAVPRAGDDALDRILVEER